MVSRRRAIALALAVAAGVAALAVPVYRRLWPTPADRLAGRLARLYPELAGAAAAMRRADWPRTTESDRPALIQALFGTDIAGALAQPAASLAATLGRAVDRDFAEARLATIDGWYLSETEARLIALMIAPAG